MGVVDVVIGLVERVRRGERAEDVVDEETKDPFFGPAVCVKYFETASPKNQSRMSGDRSSVFGLLIQTASGKSGGVGRPLTNRSGCAA